MAADPLPVALTAISIVLSALVGAVAAIITSRGMFRQRQAESDETASKAWQTLLDPYKAENAAMRLRLDAYDKQREKDIEEFKYKLEQRDIRIEALETEVKVKSKMLDTQAEKINKQGAQIEILVHQIVAMGGHPIIDTIDRASETIK